MGHHGHNNKALNFVDVIAGLFSFLLVAFFMRWLINKAVPGLLKEETFVQILQSGALFLLVWGLFLNNLFKKYLEVFELREKRSIGADAETFKVKSETKDLEQKLEHELQAVRISALVEAENIMSQARKQSAELIEQANNANDKKYALAQENMKNMQVKAKSELDKEALNLAKHFKECALKPVSQTIH